MFVHARRGHDCRGGCHCGRAPGGGAGLGRVLVTVRLAKGRASSIQSGTGEGQSVAVIFTASWCI